MSSTNSFGTSTQCTLAGESVDIFSLSKLELTFPNVATLPYSLKILLENLLRHEDARFVHTKDIEALAAWKPGAQLQKAAFSGAKGEAAEFNQQAFMDACDRLNQEIEVRAQNLYAAEEDFELLIRTRRERAN